MKKTTLSLLMTMFTAVTILNGCSTQAQKAADSQENALITLADAKQDPEEMPGDSISRFQKFKDKSSAIISDNERRIAELKINIKNEKTEAKATYERDVNALEKKNRALKKRLAEYTDDGKADWKKFKREFNQDLDALNNQFKDITASKSK